MHLLRLIGCSQRDAACTAPWPQPKRLPGVASTPEEDTLDARLVQLDPAGADPDVGLERLEQARDAREKAQRTLDDLDRETPGWRERVAEADRLEARGEAIELSDDRRVELRRRREELREEANRRSDERGGLNREVQEIEKLPGPAHVQGAIEESQAELEEVRRAHDRLALRPADRRRFDRRWRAPARAASRRGLSRRCGPPAQPWNAAADLPGAAPGDG